MYLNQCGLEYRIPASGRNVSIKLQIPNDFVWGYGLDFAYVRPAFPDLASDENRACLELLCCMRSLLRPR